MNKEVVDNDMLGLAWVKLNNWEWDDILSQKPQNFDSMKKFSNNDSDENYKRYYIVKEMSKIKEIFRERYEELTSWYWWKYELNRSHEEWMKWYYDESKVRIFYPCYQEANKNE